MHVSFSFKNPFHYLGFLSCKTSWPSLFVKFFVILWGRCCYIIPIVLTFLNSSLSQVWLCLWSFLTALLRYNPQTIQLIHLKYTVQCLSIYWVVQPSPEFNFRKISSPTQRKPVPIASYCPLTLLSPNTKIILYSHFSLYICHKNGFIQYVFLIFV